MYVGDFGSIFHLSHHVILNSFKLKNIVKCIYIYGWLMDLRHNERTREHHLELWYYNVNRSGSQFLCRILFFFASFFLIWIIEVFFYLFLSFGFFNFGQRRRYFNTDTITSLLIYCNSFNSLPCSLNACHFYLFILFFLFNIRFFCSFRIWNVLPWTWNNKIKCYC